MPIYEYQCADCQYSFEALVPFAHRDEIACEKCGENHVTRLASTFASTGHGEDGMSMSAGSGSACCGGGCGHCGN